jgi:hypothetical protein
MKKILQKRATKTDAIVRTDLARNCNKIKQT